MSPTNKKQADCLAVLGTGSDVGKSVVATALCRIFSDRGLDVCPFKAQNMSNNSHVTIEGLEMGRAQIVQAQAARKEPLVDMNPVLLKPSSDTGAQVVVHGKSVGNAQASDYFHDTDALFEKAKQSLARLRERHQLVILEGAGSCAEVNLRPRDFVNFRMAEACDAPVVLVADIDRGGVFAQIVGTLDVIPESDRKRVVGFIINRFRGDARLFEDGIQWLENRTGLPVLGLVPYFYHIDIDSEDGLPLDVSIDPAEKLLPDQINIAVIRLPHISNFTDFNPLAREPGVRLDYLARPRSLSGYDLFVLPGSKNVRADMGWLVETGWKREILKNHGQGRPILGVCGGYQMLGKTIRDPLGVEGEPGETRGLGFLEMETVLHKEKILTRTQGTMRDFGESVDGYEIHMGVSQGRATEVPVLDVASRNAQPVKDTDGAMSQDGRVWGTYLHGLFDAPGFRRAYLASLRPDLAGFLADDNPEHTADFRDSQYDLLAKHFMDHLDMDRLVEIVKGKTKQPVRAPDAEPFVNI